MRVSVRLAAAALSLATVIAPCAAQAVERPTSAPHLSTAADTRAGGTRAGDVIRGGSPDSAVDRVADFYGAYIDAVADGTDHLPDQLRAHCLTRDLQHRLSVWEQANHADGVLRAQDVPRHWEVRYHDAGAGHVFTTVTLTWGSAHHPTYTRLAVQSDLRSKLISDIEPA